MKNTQKFEAIPYDEIFFETSFIIIDNDVTIENLLKFKNGKYPNKIFQFIHQNIKNALVNKIYLESSFNDYLDSSIGIHNFDSDRFEREQQLKKYDFIFNRKEEKYNVENNDLRKIVELWELNQHNYFKDDWYFAPEILFYKEVIENYFSSIEVFKHLMHLDNTTYTPEFNTKYTEYINDKKIEEVKIEQDNFYYQMKESDIESILNLLISKRDGLSKKYPFQLKLMEHCVKKFKEGKSIIYLLKEC